MNRFLRLSSSLALCALLAVPAAAGAARDDFDLSASGISSSGYAQQLGAPKSYGSGKITLKMPKENPVAEGVNPITGEAFTGEYRPTLVSIDAHPAALPHWGAASADLIYEMPIQADGSTRELALFMGDCPDGAGPVRSARVPMCSLREMWGGVFAFYGYQGGRDKNNMKSWVEANSSVKKLKYPYLNGISKHADWFPRTSDGGHVGPHNVRLDLSAVYADYSETPKPHPFTFTETGLERGEDVNGVVINYKTTADAYMTAYEYNPATGLFERYRNGYAYTDGNTGETCAYANVIVLRTDISWASGNPSRPVIRLNGQGVAEIFQNGKYIRGSWARDCSETKNLNNRMVFFDENGEKNFVIHLLGNQDADGTVRPTDVEGGADADVFVFDTDHGAYSMEASLSYGVMGGAFTRNINIYGQPYAPAKSLTIDASNLRTFYTGDTFNPAELVVTATRANGAEESIWGGRLTFTGYDSDTTGTKTVTASFLGATATFEVQVEELVTEQYTGSYELVQGETPTATDAVLLVDYSHKVCTLTAADGSASITGTLVDVQDDALTMTLNGSDTLTVPITEGEDGSKQLTIPAHDEIVSGWGSSTTYSINEAVVTLAAE